MSITRRRNSWQVSLTHDGTRYRKSFPTRMAAELAEAEAKVRLLRDQDPWEIMPEAKRMTVADMANLTYRSRWQGSKGEETALRNMQEILDLFDRDTLFEDLVHGEIARVHRELKAKYKPATVNRKLACLSALFSVAVDEGLIPSKPKIPREKEPPGRQRYLTYDEEKALFGLLPERQRRLCTFLVETGARVGEALSARWSDIQERVWHIRDGKSGSRSLPLTSTAAQVVEQCRAVDGGPFRDITQGQLTYAWNYAKKRCPMLADDPAVVPHCLRHTCASRLVQAGVDILTVQRWLGHASLQMTMVYAHLAPTAFDSATATLTHLRKQFCEGHL